MIAALLTVGACASASSGGPEAIGPEDCSIGIPASDLLGAELLSDPTRLASKNLRELLAQTVIDSDTGDLIRPEAQDLNVVSTPPYPLTYSNGHLEGQMGEGAAQYPQFLRLGARDTDWQVMRVYQIEFELPVIIL